MTPKQKDILKFVNKFWVDNEYSPTYKEIQNGLQINSLTSVASCCKSLMRRGYLTKLKHSHRSIEVTDKGRMY